MAHDLVTAVGIHALGVQRVHHTLLFSFFMDGRGLVDGQGRWCGGGLNVDRGGHVVFQLEASSWDDASVAHDERLLEATRRGERSALVEVASSGEQQVSQASGALGGGALLDVILQLSLEFADSVSADRISDVHDVGRFGWDGVVHHGAGEEVASALHSVVSTCPFGSVRKELRRLAHLVGVLLRPSLRPRLHVIPLRTVLLLQSRNLFHILLLVLI